MNIHKQSLLLKEDVISVLWYLPIVCQMIASAKRNELQMSLQHINLYPSIYSQNGRQTCEPY